VDEERLRPLCDVGDSCSEQRSLFHRYIGTDRNMGLIGPDHPVSFTLVN
jgi:hypothetical protein